MSDARIRELVRTLLLDMKPHEVLEHVARDLFGEPMNPLQPKDLAAMMDQLGRIRSSGVTITPVDLAECEACGHLRAEPRHLLASGCSVVVDGKACGCRHGA